MLQRRVHLTNELLLYVVAFLLTQMVLVWYLYSPNFSLSLPAAYENDGLFTGVGIKSIIDTGWYLTNPYLGAPNGYQLLDYPLSDNFSFLIIKLLTFITFNYAVVMNLFYFLTFPLVVFASLFSFRKIGLNKPYAVVASVLFTFLPYHLFRGESHLFLSAYYVVPLYLLVVFSIANNETISFGKGLVYAILLVISASSGIYYAFFACYFLLIASIIEFLNIGHWQSVVRAGLAILLIGTVCFINFSPYLIYTYQQGKNTTVAHRHPNESEDVGLKISQMLLPVDGHRIKRLRELKERYNQSAPAVNENRSATLGIMGTLGFFILLSVLLIRRETPLKNQLFILSCLTLSGTLLGTIGGFGTLFSYTFSASIRSYNRISVFIAFFALAGFFIALQYVLKKINKEKYSYVLGGFLLIVGLLDQIGYGLKPDYASIKKQFNEDQAFVNEIEKQFPAGTQIFQLPVANFPENAVVHKMKDYELFKGYLHSHQLFWSYGAVRGRDVYVWQQKISQLPVEQMLNEMIGKGFKGLYVNKQGYPDQGVALENKLTFLLKQKPLQSNNGNVIFYDLTSYPTSKNLKSR